MTPLSRPNWWSTMLFIEWTMEQSELRLQFTYMVTQFTYMFFIYITLSFVTVQNSSAYRIRIELAIATVFSITVFAIINVSFEKNILTCSGIGIAVWLSVNGTYRKLSTPGPRLVPGVSVTKRLILYEFAPKGWDFVSVVRIREGLFTRNLR